MRPSAAPPLSQCPICGQGELAERPRKRFKGFRRRALFCPTCGATISHVGAGWFKLTYCAPHKLGYQGCRRCGGYFYNLCFLDRAMALPDWDRMAHRRPPVAVEEFLERSRKLKSGELPSLEAPDLAAHLAPGEVVHHVAHPVFTEDEYRPGARQDGGKLFVTSRRLLLCEAEVCSSFPYADLEELKEEYPGFCLKMRGEHVSHCFFPPALDVAFAAASGALDSFRRSRAAEQAES